MLVRPDRPPAPVPRLEQADPQTTGDRVQRDAGPDDAATDDEHVQLGGGQVARR